MKDRLAKRAAYSHVNLLTELRIFPKDRQNYLNIKRLLAGQNKTKTVTVISIARILKAGRTVPLHVRNPTVQSGRRGFPLLDSEKDFRTGPADPTHAEEILKDRAARSEPRGFPLRVYRLPRERRVRARD